LNFTPRAAITITFLAFGVMAGAQIGAFPVLKIQSGVDSLTFGILASICMAASIVAMSMGGFISKRFDNRSVLLFILPVAFVTMLGSLLVNSVVSFGVGWLVFSLCLGTMDLFMNAEASIVERDLAKPVFSSFHAAVLYAMGAGGLASGYVSVTYGAAWSALLALPLAGLAMLAVNAAIAHHAPDAKAITSREPLPRKALTLIGIIIGLDIAAEITCVQWSGQLLADMQPALAQYSGLGLAFYGLCNGTVRLFGDRLRARYSDMTLIAVSLLIGFSGFVILMAGTGFAVSIIAFAIVGGGLGLIFPCLFSVTANLAPNNRAGALAFASAVSGPPRIFFPVLLGLLAQDYGLGVIYIAAGTACALAFFVTLWTSREINRRPLSGAAQSFQ
jgi:MFS family permease